MPEHDLRQQIADERHAQLMGVLTEVRDLARMTNGRVTALETKVAVMEAVGIAQQGGGPSRKAIAGYASAASTGVVAIVEIAKAVVAAVKG